MCHHQSYKPPSVEFTILTKTDIICKNDGPKIVLSLLARAYTALQYTTERLLL